MFNDAQGVKWMQIAWQILHGKYLFYRDLAISAIRIFFTVE